MIRDDVRIKEYLNQVCGEVRAREAHREIRAELLSHLEDLVMEREGEGRSRDEAVDWAIRQMGDAETVGRGLHQVHRPRMNWGLLAGGAMAAVLGILGIFVVELGLEANQIYFFSGAITVKKTIFTIIGGLLMCALYFCDYRKLQSCSMYIYGIALLCVVICGSFGYQSARISYITVGIFSFSLADLITFLLLLAAPGLLMQWKAGGRFWLKSTLFFVVIPAVCFIKYATLTPYGVYLGSYLLLLRLHTGRWTGSMITGLILIGAVGSWIIKHFYLYDRFTAFWNPEQDPLNRGFHYLAIKNNLQAAGWWGHGIGAPLSSRLPEILNNNVLVYIIHCVGWLGGIAIVMALIYFLERLIRSNLSVQDRYGRLLGTTLSSVLVIQMAYSLLMTTGWVPILNILFPFLSYGGSHLIVEMGIVGLVLGIYRRKDLVRVSPGPGRTF